MSVSISSLVYQNMVNSQSLMLCALVLEVTSHEDDMLAQFRV